MNRVLDDVIGDEVWRRWSGDARADPRRVDRRPRAGAVAGAIGLAALDDGAALPLGDQWLVVTTDSHVIQPVFFPGGDIGRLAVSGTVNDLAMMGATDVLALTCAVIVEEGFPRADLVRIQTLDA